MDTVDFNVLVDAFDAECKKAGYAKAEVQYRPTAQKRSYAQTSSSGGRGGYSGSNRGGGSYKRGRRY